MKKFKRMLAVAFTLVIALTSSNLVHADVNANGGGGGFIDTGSTEENVGSIFLYHINQGFRAYIVNEQGLAVSNSVDFVKYRPWEVKASFDPSKTYEATERMWNDWFHVTGIWETEKTSIAYLSGVKTDNIYIQSYGGMKKDGSLPDSTERGVKYLTREKQEDTEGSGEGLYYSSGKMYLISELEQGLRTWIEQDYGSWKITGERSYFTYKSPITGEEKRTFNKIMAPIEESIDKSEGIVGTGDEMVNLMTMPLSEDFEVDDTIVLQYLVSMQMPDKNGIGLTINGGALKPLLHFTDSTVNNKYQELLSKAETATDKRYAIIKTMEELGLKVAFEPVSWSVPTIPSSQLPSLNENKWGYAWTADTIVYGTPTNVAQYCLAQFVPMYKEEYPDCGIPDLYQDYNNCLSWLRDKDAGLDWHWGLTQYAYKTIEDIPEYNMVAYDENVMSPGDFTVLGDNKNRVGYGVMYFDINLEVGARTSTWDKEAYPETNYKPGPSEQTTNNDGSFPTEYPSEGEEYKQLNKDHKFNIIKFYGEKQADGSVVYTENHTRENTVHNIRIDDEVDYKVENWFTSSELKKPMSDDDSYDDYKSALPNGLEGSESGSVVIKPDSTDKVLYVKLVKEKPADSSVEGDIKEKVILHEDELAYPYSLEDIGLKDLWETFPDKSYSGSNRHSGSDDDDDWYCSWHRVLNDDSYNLNVRNAFDYSTTNFIGSAGIFAGIEGGKVNTSDSEKSASLSGFDTQHLVPNWKFSLYRDKVKDKVTLYPNKNSSQITSNMSLIGVDSTSYIPSNRVAKEGSGNFKDKFSINYIYDNSDRTLSWRSAGCGSHGDSGSYSGTPNMGLDAFNNSYSVANNVITKYYLGKENKGTVQPDSTNSAFSMFGKTYKINCNVFQKNGVIKFYPMIKMTYQTQNGGEQGVYVTSTNESQVLGSTRVESGFYRSLNGKPNLNLDSTQWSTHGKTQSFLSGEGIADKNSVLPGGALYSLDADAEGRETWLGIKCWQTVVEDSQLDSLIEKEGVKSRSQADADWNNFKSTSKNVLEHYQIVQYAAPGIHKSLADFNKAKGKALVSGAGQVNKFGGNTLDRSGKYYLKVDGSGADRSDLDILTEQEQVIVYKVLSDVMGNVFVLKDGMEIGRISKTQGAAQLLEIPEIKELDDKTKIISNYISGIDRNQGSDRDNQTWYNEAFDGVSVVYRQWAVQLGFGNGQSARSSALDTKLTGKLGDRRDLYNFSEASLAEKTRTSLFQLSTRSTDPSANGKADGYIGSIDGLDIRNNMAASMYSKLFYIPNASVTDLN